MAQKTNVFTKVVEKYRKDAQNYFERCGVIPDIGDLAGCIFDYWKEDSCIDLTDDDYKGLLEALGFDFEEDTDEDDTQENTCPGCQPSNTPPAFKVGPVPTGN
jgi:hypothetical protein